MASPSYSLPSHRFSLPIPFLLLANKNGENPASLCSCVSHAHFIQQQRGQVIIDARDRLVFVSYTLLSFLLSLFSSTCAISTLCAIRHYRIHIYSPTCKPPSRRDGISQRVRATRIAETWEPSPGDPLPWQSPSPSSLCSSPYATRCASLQGRKEGEVHSGRAYVHKCFLP